MRTNLKVPFAEKDEAKKLGARWDAAENLVRRGQAGYGTLLEMVAHPSTDGWRWAGGKRNSGAQAAGNRQGDRGQRLCRGRSRMRMSAVGCV